jgi:transcription initiation factor IIF auxiliary subunit
VALSIQQAQEYMGNDRWRWSVWLDGEPQDLDLVDHVVYILHPTFHHPVREVCDRSTNFRLETSSWGAFTIHAKAMLRDGREVTLDHDLVLVYPDGTPTAA